jgi:hypothetical protein
MANDFMNPDAIVALATNVLGSSIIQILKTLCDMGSQIFAVALSTVTTSTSELRRS